MTRGGGLLAVEDVAPAPAGAEPVGHEIRWSGADDGAGSLRATCTCNASFVLDAGHTTWELLDFVDQHCLGRSYG